MKYKYFFIVIISTLALLCIWAISLIVQNIGIVYLDVPSISTQDDMNENGIDDITDILIWARKEIENKTNYHSAYYAGWYPPKNEGVCSDVIWRAFQEMWYDLKSAIDEDIQNNISLYPRVSGQQDTNIDFRRVSNLQIYFQRKHESLSLELIPWNIKNLQKWQAGDIVIFGKPKEHIAIISNKRNTQWVPYMIHNSAPSPREDDWLEYWNKEVSPIVGHYRIVKNWEFK